MAEEVFSADIDRRLQWASRRAADNRGGRESSTRKVLPVLTLKRKVIILDLFRHHQL